jgi:alkanesulfonate monooxygenase SsuD/methylene tetrahydromethanopterin reductase-like flavin-dependent oxidoreductase (luciferase family)
MPPPERPVRIFVAANGPRMLELAGELADGTLGYFNSAAYIREVVVPAVERGAARAGRSRATSRSPAASSVVTRDESGLGLARGQVLMFSTALESALVCRQRRRGRLRRRGGRDPARAAAGDADGPSPRSPTMVDALTLSGSPEHVRRIDELRSAGLATVCLNPCPPGAWFPLYEGHLAAVPGPAPDIPAFLQVIGDTIELVAPT